MCVCLFIVFETISMEMELHQGGVQLVWKMDGSVHMWMVWMIINITIDCCNLQSKIVK